MAIGTNILGIEITPAKVVAAYLALQPILADATGAWDKLTEIQQSLLLAGSLLGVIVYLVMYGLYVRDKRVAQIQYESNQAAAGLAPKK